MSVGATVLTDSLFTEVVEELDAIQGELGTFVYGTSGSLMERVRMFMDPVGGFLGNTKECDAADGQIRRIRAGIVDHSFDDLDSVDTYSGLATVTWSPPLSAFIQSTSSVMLHIEPVIEPADRANLDVPTYVWLMRLSGDGTSFEYRVATANNNPPASGDRWFLHWLAWERSLDGSSNDIE